MNTTLLIILIVLLSIICIILFIISYNQVKRQESLEDLIIAYEERQETTNKTLNLMLEQMRAIDIRGSFESDDEVGVVFNSLKSMVEEYTNL
jgi:cytochrome oxidase assembly protein ShyY1